MHFFLALFRTQHVMWRWPRPARGAVIRFVMRRRGRVLAQVPMMRGLEDWLLDGSFVLRGTRATAAKVLLVDIDDQSLDQLKKPLLFLSPELAEIWIISTIREPPPSASTFSFPESYSSLPALQAGAEGDATPLGLAIERSGKVVLPEWQVEDQTLRPLVQWQLKALGDAAPTARTSDW